MTERTDRTERCEVCRWWQADNPDTGTCHRHAPRPAEPHMTNWPTRPRRMSGVASSSYRRRPHPLRPCGDPWNLSG